MHSNTHSHPTIEIDTIQNHSNNFALNLSSGVKIRSVYLSKRCQLPLTVAGVTGMIGAIVLVAVAVAFPYKVASVIIRHRQTVDFSVWVKGYVIKYAIRSRVVRKS